MDQYDDYVACCVPLTRLSLLFKPTIIGVLYTEIDLLGDQCVTGSLTTLGRISVTWQGQIVKFDMLNQVIFK